MCKLAKSSARIFFTVAKLPASAFTAGTSFLQSTHRAPTTQKDNTARGPSQYTLQWHSHLVDVAALAATAVAEEVSVTAADVEEDVEDEVGSATVVVVAVREEDEVGLVTVDVVLPEAVEARAVDEAVVLVVRRVERRFCSLEHATLS
jgi:hypothetical protein